MLSLLNKKKLRPRPGVEFIYLIYLFNLFILFNYIYTFKSHFHKNDLQTN